MNSIPNMPKGRVVTVRQLEILVEFAEKNPELVTGRTVGPLASRAMREAWQSLALHLNCIADGCTKSTDQWRRYWIDYKAKTKTKAADLRRSGLGTGRVKPLNNFERRVLKLTGPTVVPDPIKYGLQSSASSCLSVLPSPECEGSREVDWLDSGPHTNMLNTTSNPAESPIGPSDLLSPHPEEGVDRSQPEVIIREYGDTLRASQPNRRLRLRRPGVRQEARVPRWVYNLESRRVAAEERVATAVEALVDIVRDIRDNIRELNS